MSKSFISASGFSFSLFDNFFRIERHLNPGIAFSFPIPMFFQIGFSFLFLAGLVLFYKKSVLTFGEKIALAAIVGGAIGNLRDRIFDGAVVDFLAVWNFPVFNIADTAIFCGVCGFFFFDFWKKKPRQA